MKVIEIIFACILIIGITYTAIPLFILAFLIAQPAFTNSEGVFKASITEEVTVEVPVQHVPVYTNTSLQPKTIAQLQTALQMCNPPQPYSKSYDCSELSSYTEYYLENNGFNTTISASFTEGHAWCSVCNIIGYDIVHVECIPPVHISEKLPPVERSYNNITEALAGEYPYEWDWWCT
jgi:hypothetical protein